MSVWKGIAIAVGIGAVCAIALGFILVASRALRA